MEKTASNAITSQTAQSATCTLSSVCLELLGEPEMSDIFECTKCGKRFSVLDEEEAASEGYECDPDHEECPSCYTYDKFLEE